MTPYELSLALHAARLASIPQGVCKCGCGGITPIATFTRKKFGLVRGLPINYIRGHNKSRSLKAHADQLRCICRNPLCQIPYGLCHCGCGQKTKISPQGHSRLGHIKGMPRKFIVGHSGICRPPLRMNYEGEIDGALVVFIPLTQCVVAVVDKEDGLKVKGTWTNCRGYAVRMVRGERFFMHHLILPRRRGFVIDHINGMPWDNRKVNLRYATVSQNIQNSRIRSNNTSGVKGVYWDSEKRMWAATLKVDGEDKFLGRSRIFEVAVKLRKDAELRWFGEFSRKG